MARFVRARKSFSGRCVAAALILLAGLPAAAADTPEDAAARAIRVAPRAASTPDRRASGLPGAPLDTRFTVVLQSGHTDAVHDVLFDPTGKYLVSYGQFGAIKVWALDTGTVLRDYSHARRATDCRLLAMDPGGRRIATGANDGRVNIWAVAEDRLIRSIDTGLGPLSGVAFTPDGSLLVARPGRPIERWHPDTGERIGILGKSFFNQRYATNQRFEVGPAGRFLVAAGGDVLSRHDVTTGAALRGYRLPSGKVTAVCPIPGKELFAAGGSDGVVTVWNARTGEAVHRLSGPHKLVSSLCTDPSGSLLVAGGDGDITFWRLSDGSLVRTLKQVHVRVTALAVDPAGRTLVSAGTAGEIKIWNLETGGAIRALLPLKVHHGDMVDAIRRIEMGPKARFLVTETGSRAVSVWDLASLKLVRAIDLSSNQHTVRIDPTGRFIATSRPGNHLDIWDAATGNRVRTFTDERPYYHVTGFSFDPTGRIVVTEHDSGGMRQRGTHPVVCIWSMDSGKRLGTIADAHSIHITSRGRAITGLTPAGTVRVWDIPSGRLRHDFPSGASDPGAAQPVAGAGPRRPVPQGVWKTILGPRGDILLALRLTGKMDILNITDGHTVATVELAPNRITSNDMARVRFDASGRFVLYATVNRGTGKIWHARTGRRVLAPQGHRSTINTMVVSPDETRALTVGYSDIILWDLDTGTPIRTFKDRLTATACAVDGSWQRMAVQTGGRIEVWNLSTGAQENTWEATGRLLDLERAGPPGTPVQGAVYTEAAAGTAAGRLWDPFTGNPVDTAGLSFNEARFMVRGDYTLSVTHGIQVCLGNTATGHTVTLTNAGPEWVVTAPDGYFDASKHGGALVSMVRGMDAYGVDQFAVRNNRPDILLTRMGLGGARWAAHFEQQYRRRLKKLGFGQADLSPVLQVPRAAIIEVHKEGRYATLTCEFSDAHYPLKDYRVYVNGVALFGREAKPLSGKRQRVRETVALASGTNTIEVSCTNAGGAASFRAMNEVVLPGAAKGDLYVLGFGVSDYRDPSLNLGYAAKDATDLAELFGRMNGAFNKVLVKTLVDDAVTPSAVTDTRSFLAGAGVDDTVVVFIAGHGVYDPKDASTYYYMTHDADLDDLSATALPYEALEAVLDGVAPRKRLILMDTCESGEVADDLQETFMTAASAQGLTPRTTRAIIVAQRTHPGRQGQAPSELNRYIYNDLLRRSGATVLSSSRGDEFSYESDRFENGFFTEAMMTALTTTDADRNGDLYLSGEELQHYLSERVAGMSGDLQHPTVDRDNIHQEIRLPLLRVSAAETAADGDIPLAHLHWYLGEPVAVFTNARQADTGSLKTVNARHVLLDRSAQGKPDLQIPIENIQRVEKR
ncbi:MAG: caspase family protein [Pseudomonadota bacterium]